MSYLVGGRNSNELKMSEFEKRASNYLRQDAKNVSLISKLQKTVTTMKSTGTLKPVPVLT
jgi:hypothetical protein